MDRSYLDVLVELICNVLPWSPAAEVLVLHLLDPLNGIFGNCVQRTHDTAICKSVSFGLPHGE